MEGHQLNKEGRATPVVGEVVLVVGDQKNRGEWKKGKVSRLIQGEDGVVRGVIFLLKGHTTEKTSTAGLSIGDTRRESAETCSSTGSRKDCITNASRRGGLNLN